MRSHRDRPLTRRYRRVPMRREERVRMRAPCEVVREHWPEYLMEAAGLGLFMISAAVVTALFEYPESLLNQLLPNPVVRRVLIGVAMGLTAIGIIYSPWGKR